MPASRHAWRARFSIRPIRGDERTAVVAEARLATRAGEERIDEPVVRTLVTLGEETWPVELRLILGDPRRLGLHLGRRALERRFVIDPQESFLAGPPTPG